MGLLYKYLNLSITTTDIIYDKGLKFIYENKILLLSMIFSFKTAIQNFFHYDILTRNVYIILFRKYNMAGEN